MGQLRADNLGDGHGARGRMQVGRLTRGRREAERFTGPMVVILTDSAFDEHKDKVSWLRTRLGAEALAATLREGTATVLMPPLVVSVSGGSWAKEADELRDATGGAAVPVHVLAPSPPLNRPGDSYPTVLPGGYLLAAHLLGGRDQRLTNPHVRIEPSGRYQVLGGGAASMDESLRRVVWGYVGRNGRVVNHPLAVDMYLHVILTLVAHAQDHGCSGGVGPDTVPQGLYRYLFRTADAFNDAQFRQATHLDPVLLGRACRLALDGNPSDGLMNGVLLSLDPGKSVGDGTPIEIFTDVAWWMNQRRMFQLP